MPKTDAARAALRLEQDYLAGVLANVEQNKGVHLIGSLWETVTDDDGDALRAMMASRRLYDRDLLKQLPHNRRVSVKGAERFLFFWRRPTGTVTVSALSPLEDLLDSDAEAAAPIGVTELRAHLQKVAGSSKVRQVVAVCAPTGFTEEARQARRDMPSATVVLAEPDPSGGWRITCDDDVPPFVRKMFDPEDAERKIERVRREVERCSPELITGGLGADALADRLHLPTAMVEAALSRIAADDPELRVSKSSGSTLLYRGAPTLVKEKSMSFVDRIKEMFAREGNEGNKINVLAERRAALAQRRDRLYEEIGKLEEREAELLQQGRENKSTVVRRRLAAQVAQIRKDIGRQNTTAKMLNQQINIISTDIHNLTLIQQGEAAALPTTEELTENAVKAEEMLETLRSDADLVESLETGVGEVLATGDELDIMAEFDAPPEAASATGTSRAGADEQAEDRIAAEFDEQPEPPTPAPRKKQADPETS